MDKTLFFSNAITFISGGKCNFWSINPYKHCDHRCTYCISGVQGNAAPAYPPDQMLQNLSNALTEIPAHRRVIIGGISDAYPHAEERHGLTRQILRRLNQSSRTYSIITKGAIVERDIDLLVENPASTVIFSFSTLDDDLAQEFERHATPPSERFRVLKKMYALGVNVRVSLRPWIPTVSDIQQVMDHTPEDVPIGLERLKITRANRTFSIRGKSFSQEDIDDLYRAEAARYSGCERLNWRMDTRFSSVNEKGEHPCADIYRRKEVIFSELKSKGRLIEATSLNQDS